MFLGRAALSADDWAKVIHALRLSKREAEITRLVFDDQCDKEIGAELRISPHTVNTHLQRMYGKLGVNSRVQLVVAVFRECRRDE